MMKKMTKLCVLLFITFTATSCGLIEINPDEILIDDGALTQTVNAGATRGEPLYFNSTGAWNSTVSADWLSITPDSGDKEGGYVITITLEPNTAGADRIATITITCGKANVVITVTQKGSNKGGDIAGYWYNYRVTMEYDYEGNHYHILQWYEWLNYKYQRKRIQSINGNQGTVEYEYNVAPPFYRFDSFGSMYALTVTFDEVFHEIPAVASEEICGSYSANGVCTLKATATGDYGEYQADLTYNYSLLNDETILILSGNNTIGGIAITDSLYFSRQDDKFNIGSYQ